jgi:hypothetical protein
MKMLLMNLSAVYLSCNRAQQKKTRDDFFYAFPSAEKLEITSQLGGMYSRINLCLVNQWV